MEEVKITIIGAGVVGLSIAAELSSSYDNILVVEKHSTFGQETSSRNSEVIHSGIYYPSGSLKAQLCVEGAQKLYEICKIYSIPHKKIGKLVVATEQEEIKTIEEFYKNGRKNNVQGLVILNKQEINRMEPNINAVTALFSPNTGIVDSHSLMKHLYNLSRKNGVLFAFNCEVNSMLKEKNAYVVGIKDEDYYFKSKIVINCAGLSSDYIASIIGIDVMKNGYKLKYCKGSYFSFTKPSPIKKLVYPLPHRELVGLGIHTTLDLGGRLRFGPDSEYVGEINYNVNPGKRDEFYRAVSRFINGLEKDAFVPDMAGIRPKLSGEGEQVRDFVIKDETDKGFEGLINLIGIESPGLSASPAIAEMVKKMVNMILN